MDISVQHEGSVAILTWDDGENRINLDSLAARSTNDSTS